MDAFSNVGNILLAALGISFLIFIHELGHFLAARLFGVRVDIFSIGFGPRIWGWQRGPTDYRISAIPLGGYVKMAGEYGDYDEQTKPAEDDLMAKPAWQRAIVFAGGVIVNFAFAFVVFPLAFTMGVPFTAPIIGSVTPGGAAWVAGLQHGDEVLQIDGNRVYQFVDVALEVALGDPERMVARIRRDGRELDIPLRPARNVEAGRYEIGIGPALDPQVDIAPDSPAFRAGMRSGDRLVALGGVDVDDSPEGLGSLLATVFQSGEPILIRYERDGELAEVLVTPATHPDGDQRLIGVNPIQTKVVARRGPGDSDLMPLRPGDIVVSVAGTPVYTSAQLMSALVDAPEGQVRLAVRRGQSEGDVTLSPSARDALQDGDVAFEHDFDSLPMQYPPGGALADSGFVDGDTILSVDDAPLTSFRDLQTYVREGGPDFRLDVRRASTGEVESINVQARGVTNWDYGLIAQVLSVEHEEGLAGSIRAGFDLSVNILRTTWLTLTKLVTGDVAASNLGGIVEISRQTYRFAELGFAHLLFFLGLLSINLGFINILPIPVLDGGQMLFLLFEKIKGSRLSERFMNSMQIAGLVAILALVVYVTFNDIMRLVG